MASLHLVLGGNNVARTRQYRSTKSSSLSGHLFLTIRRRPSWNPTLAYSLRLQGIPLTRRSSVDPFGCCSVLHATQARPHQPTRAKQQVCHQLLLAMWLHPNKLQSVSITKHLKPCLLLRSLAAYFRSCGSRGLLPVFRANRTLQVPFRIAFAADANRRLFRPGSLKLRGNVGNDSDLCPVKTLKGLSDGIGSMAETRF